MRVWSPFFFISFVYLKFASKYVQSVYCPLIVPYAVMLVPAVIEDRSKSPAVPIEAASPPLSYCHSVKLSELDALARITTPIPEVVCSTDNLALFKAEAVPKPPLELLNIVVEAIALAAKLPLESRSTSFEPVFVVAASDAV